MTQEHPITLPPELVRKWVAKNYVDLPIEHVEVHLDDVKICTEAARWGADMELEACCEWIYKLMDRGLEWSMDLRTARRPKPPSLKEQALAALDDAVMRGDCITISDALPTIRRALEALPE